MDVNTTSTFVHALSQAFEGRCVTQLQCQTPPYRIVQVWLVLTYWLYIGQSITKQAKLCDAFIHPVCEQSSNKQQQNLCLLFVS